MNRLDRRSTVWAWVSKSGPTRPEGSTGCQPQGAAVIPAIAVAFGVFKLVRVRDPFCTMARFSQNRTQNATIANAAPVPMRIAPTTRRVQKPKIPQDKGRQEPIEGEGRRRDKAVHCSASLSGAPVPTRALIQGACFGGGTGVIAACDVLIAAFTIAEVRSGVTAASKVRSSRCKSDPSKE